MIDRALTSALVLVGLLTTMVAGCQPQSGPETSPVDTAAVKAEFDSLRSLYEEAYARGDLESAVNAVYHPDIVYSPPFRSPVRSRDATIAHERQARLPEATLDVDPTEVRVLGPEWAYEFGTVTVSFTPEGAEGAQSTESTYLVVYRKTDEGWRIYRESISSHQPPPDAP